MPLEEKYSFKEENNFLGDWLDPKHSILASQVFEIMGAVYKTFPTIS